MIALAAVTSAACGSSSPAACDSAQCDANNLCIARAGAAAQCELPCYTHTDCPFNYHCDANAGGTRPYCLVNTTTFPEEPGKQFGAPCNPTGGFQNNPACDGADGFACLASSPLDANAYCTYLSCKSDTDCGDGFYCGRVNATPSATSSAPPDGQTLVACLPRGYCAPCASDIDCAPTNGAPQHCVAGTDGATFCVPECHANTDCALDATCTSHGNYSACTPRAGVCKGDGSLCSPCRSDADCSNGFCVLAYNSTEHFCTTPSGITCSYDKNLNIVDQCPSSTKATPTIGCAVPSVDPTIPANQCEGEVLEGSSPVPGCWTVH